MKTRAALPLPALLLFIIGAISQTGATWKPEYAQADPAVADWYRNAELTPAAQEHYRFKSCCAHSDVVKTKFRVNKTNGTDEWWYVDADNQWVQVPDYIIHWGESAPDGQPTLFAIGTLPTCFWPGESGN